MTPYLVNRTWVDLDCVEAVEEHIYTDSTRSISIVGRATLAFRDQPLEIALGQLRAVEAPPGSYYGGWAVPDECKKMWDAFKDAWKHRDTARLNMVEEKR